MMKLFLLFFLLLIYSTPLISQEIDNKPSINHRLQLIPPEERKVLEEFFRRLFYHADFSYTLFGLKPMGSIDYSLSYLRFPVFYKNPEQHLYLMALDEKDWKVWESYQHLFPMEKYSFIKVEKDGSFGFFLVNKEKSYAVIEKIFSFSKISQEKKFVLLRSCICSAKDSLPILFLVPLIRPYITKPLDFYMDTERKMYKFL